MRTLTIKFHDDVDQAVVNSITAGLTYKAVVAANEAGVFIHRPWETTSDDHAEITVTPHDGKS